MRILVTGGAGFIGSHLGERLLTEGHDVVVVDNFVTGQKGNIQQLVQHDRFHFFELDVSSPDFKETVRTAGPFDRVYHLACPTGVPNCVYLAEVMINACSVGVKQVLEIAAENRAKTLVVSSSEVYGDPLFSPQEEAYTGNVSTISPRSPYEEGKRFSETVAMMFYRKYNVPVTIVRLFNVYGPRMATSDARVIPRLVTQALQGAPLTVYGNGKQTRTFCYVSDMVEGFLTALEKGEAGEVYNIGGEKEFTMNELAAMIKEATGSSSEIILQDHPLNLKDHKQRMPSLAKIRALGWKQRVAFEEGLQKVIPFFLSALEKEGVEKKKERVPALLFPFPAEERVL